MAGSDREDVVEDFLDQMSTYIRKSVEEIRADKAPAGESEDDDKTEVNDDNSGEKSQASESADDKTEVNDDKPPAPPVKASKSEKPADEPKPKRRHAWFGDID